MWEIFLFAQRLHRQDARCTFITVWFWSRKTVKLTGALYVLDVKQYPFRFLFYFCKPSHFEFKRVHSYVAVPCDCRAKPVTGIRQLLRVILYYIVIFKIQTTFEYIVIVLTFIQNATSDLLNLTFKPMLITRK